MNNLAAQNSQSHLSSSFRLATTGHDFVDGLLDNFEPLNSWETLSPAFQPLRFFEVPNESTAPRLTGVSVARPESVKACAAPARESALLEWMMRIVGRDEQAFTALYNACAPRTRRAVSKIVADRYLAEEVTADCYWQVWRDAGRYEERRGSVLAWIAAIARSRAVDAIRRRCVYRKHEEAMEDFEAMLDERAGEFPCSRIDEQRRVQGLLQMLSCLDPVQRQLLSLAFVKGLSHQEIAVRSDMALGTVKSHIRRGLASLHCLCKVATRGG